MLPDERFGPIHGKAGVITLADGRKTAFLGSVNESLTAWRLNYELLGGRRPEGSGLGTGGVRRPVGLTLRGRAGRVRGPDREGGGVTPAVLPHHRAYGSRTTAVPTSHCWASLVPLIIRQPE